MNTHFHIIPSHARSKTFQVLTKAVLLKAEKGAQLSDDGGATSEMYENPVADSPRLLSGFYSLSDPFKRHARLHELWSTAVRRRMDWCGFDVPYLRSELNPPYQSGPRFAKMWLNGGEKKKQIKWWEQCYNDGFVSLTRDDAEGMGDKS